NITKGLYYDGNDYYYVLEQGVFATDYLLNLHGNKYYFGDDGKMVKDEIVEFEDEKYYCDPNGTMIKDTWLTHQEIDDDGTIESVTYYFGPAGRAYRAVNRSNNMVIKNIDGMKYGFNEYGARLEGYVTRDGESVDVQEEEAIDQILYYFDPEEDYATASGWILYNGVKPEELDDGEEMYFYFDEKTGRKLSARMPGTYYAREIEGERYLFDYYGIRQKKWHQVATTSIPRYYSEDYEGFLTKGWFEAVPKEDSIEEKNRQYFKDNEEQWYYAATDGKIVRNTIKKIGIYFYCFDKDGVMQSDCLVAVDGNTYIASYKIDEVTRNQVVLCKDEGGILEDGQKWMYFMEPDEETKVGAMCPLNKNLLLELGDEDVTFIANSHGGYGYELASDPAERNGKYYQNGVLIKPLEDCKYGIVRRHKLSVDSAVNYKVVGKSGNRITKPGALKDENGNFILVGEDGTYLGTYAFSKCRLSIVNSNRSWVIEDQGGNQIVCPENDLASLADRMFTSKKLCLNFVEYPTFNTP
ncbi:MAG: hypothetical protein MJ151_01915, partial [Lachnospiraceae bacterium]|nr:hypothetical protein [Lachnospiraceae bacterium]